MNRPMTPEEDQHLFEVMTRSRTDSPVVAGYLEGQAVKRFAHVKAMHAFQEAMPSVICKAVRHAGGTMGALYFALDHGCFTFNGTDSSHLEALAHLHVRDLVLHEGVAAIPRTLAWEVTLGHLLFHTLGIDIENPGDGQWFSGPSVAGFAIEKGADFNAKLIEVAQQIVEAG